MKVQYRFVNGRLTSQCFRYNMFMNSFMTWMAGAGLLLEWITWPFTGRPAFVYAHSREEPSHDVRRPSLLYRCGLQLLPRLQSTVHVAGLISPTICWLEARRCRSWAFDRYKLRLSSAASPKDSCNMARRNRSPGVCIGIFCRIFKGFSVKHIEYFIKSDFNWCFNFWLSKLRVFSHYDD